jgi:hypothetical protein
MDRSLQTAGFALLAWLAFAPAPSFAADKPTPLKLKLSASSAPAPLRTVRNPRRPAHFQQATPSLSQRAMQSLLQDADDDAASAPAAGGNAKFRFKRRGDAGRDLAASYNSMCDSVSQKLWDEPDGKRVRFDIAGKPGVALEIPLR